MKGTRQARDVARVRWRSRRGMLELDLFLADFAACGYPALEPALKADYRALLELDDWVVLDWLREREPPAPEFRAIVAAIAAFHRRAAGAN